MIKNNSFIQIQETTTQETIPLYNNINNNILSNKDTSLILLDNSRNFGQINSFQIEILEAVKALNITTRGHTPVSDLLLNCGREFEAFQCNNEGCVTHTKEHWIDRFQFVTSRCKSRFCLSCQRLKKYQDLNKYSGFVRGFSNFYFMTLTFKNREFISKEYVQSTKVFIKRYFAELKRKYGFVVGNYLKAIDNTHSKEKGHHFHYHIILEIEEDQAKLLDDFTSVFKKDGNTKGSILSKEWHNQTGDSFIMNIVPLMNDPVYALNYMMKYLGKIEFEDAEEYVRYCDELHGIQFIRPSRRFKKIINPMKCSSCGGKMSYTGKTPIIEIPEFEPPDEESVLCSDVEGISIFNSYDDMFQKIDPFLNTPHNINLIEEALPLKDIEQLVHMGYFYRHKHDEFRRL